LRPVILYVERSVPYETQGFRFEYLLPPPRQSLSSFLLLPLIVCCLFFAACANPAGDDGHKDEVGLFFDGMGSPVKAEIVAVNEPKTLKVIIPAGLAIRTEYTLKIVTQSSAKNGAALLKTVREVRSDFKLVVSNLIGGA
jgi:hypothetical protein